MNQNSKEIEDQIYEILKSALHKLHEITYLKLKLLLSEKIEISKRINEIGWLESFLKYQKDLTGMSSFLKIWSKHLNFRDQLLNLPDIAPKNVIPDIKLNGSLYISSSESDNTSLNYSKSPNLKLIIYYY